MVVSYTWLTPTASKHCRETDGFVGALGPVWLWAAIWWFPKSWGYPQTSSILIFNGIFSYFLYKPSVLGDPHGYRNSRIPATHVYQSSGVLRNSLTSGVGRCGRSVQLNSRIIRTSARDEIHPYASIIINVCITYIYTYIGFPSYFNTHSGMIYLWDRSRS